jgi:hypothetical protein
MTYLLSRGYLEHKTETLSFQSSTTAPFKMILHLSDATEKNNNQQIRNTKANFPTRAPFTNSTLPRVWTLANNQRAERSGRPIKLEWVVANCPTG